MTMPRLPFAESMLILLHVLTTGDEYGVCVTKDMAETIELAWMLLDASSLRILNQGSILVRPTSTPITDLCCNITGLRPEDVQTAGSFAHAIGRLSKNILEFADVERTAFSFIAMDAWDLTIQLPREAHDKQTQLPFWLDHARVYDLADIYFGLHREGVAPAPAAGLQKSTSNVCTALGLPLINRLGDRMPNTPALSPSFSMHPGARPRRALDECHNLLAITRQLLQLSMPSWQDRLRTHFPFRQPIDGLADYVTFVKEASCVLFLEHVPPETTQSELEAWALQHGVRAVTFWTLAVKDLEPPSGTGFILFASHADACAGLVLNGRGLGDKVVRVSASSSRVVGRAAPALVSFPASKNRPRFGDWMCGVCGFCNFQRRQVCHRCNAAAGLALTNSLGQHQQQQHQQHALRWSMSGPTSPVEPPTGYFQPMPYTGYTSPPIQSYGLFSPGLSLASNSTGANTPTLPTGPTSPAFRSGDWHCGLCAFHNFARNIACLRCAAQRGAQAQQAAYRFELPNEQERWVR